MHQHTHTLADTRTVPQQGRPERKRLRHRRQLCSPGISAVLCAPNAIGHIYPSWSTPPPSSSTRPRHCAKERLQTGCRPRARSGNNDYRSHPTHTHADRNAKDPSERPTHIHAGTYGHTRTRVRTYDAQYFSSVDTLSAFVCQRELCDGLSSLADAVYN